MSLSPGLRLVPNTATSNKPRKSYTTREKFTDAEILYEWEHTKDDHRGDVTYAAHRIGVSVRRLQRTLGVGRSTYYL